MSFDRCEFRVARAIVIAVVFLFVLTATGLLSSQALAQSLISGDIAGTVTDPSGAVVTDATVSLKNLETGATQQTKSSASGAYRFALLKPGRYQVTVEHTGFEKSENAVSVTVGQITTVNIQLPLGQSTQTLEVTSEAPLVNPEASQSTSFSEQAVQNLPNPGGDITNIAQLAPGATMNTSGGYGNLTVNGLPATSNVFTINGENDMDPFFNTNNSGASNLTLGLNEIQEATVVTNPYSGQYGQLAGAQVNYITKSGSNNFHGSAKYLWNGRALNANDWFAKNVCGADGTANGNPNCNGSTADRPFANNNQWGADFGGPIVKDKTFFYVNTEGLTYVLPTVQSVYAPTQEFANAVIANLPAASQPLYKQLFSYMVGAPGSQNASPVAGGGCGDIINPDGTSNVPGITASTNCIVHYTATPTAHSNEWILSGRVDQNIGNNDRAYLRFRMDHGSQATYTDPFNSLFNATSSQPSYDTQFQETHVFSGQSTNQFLATLTWYAAPFITPNNPQDTFADTLRFNLAGDQAVTGLADTIGFPQGRSVTQYQFVDDFSHIRGSHDLKFGVNFRRYDISDTPFTYRYPLVEFADMTGFATDKPYIYEQRFSNIGSEVPYALYGLGMYASDEWKVKSNLKLTLALRAEHNSNPVCQTNCFVHMAGYYPDLNATATTPYNAVLVPDQHQAFASTDAVNWSPRFGFTWSPFGGGNTVISGGVGIFYDSLPFGMLENSIRNAPNAFTAIDRSGASWANGAIEAEAANSANLMFSQFASGASYQSLSASSPAFASPSLVGFPFAMHTPQYQEWNLQVQQALGNTMSLTLNYYGNHGIHIPIENTNYNAVDTATCGSTQDANCFAGATPLFPTVQPNLSFTTVGQWNTAAVSNSNGLNVSLAKRMSHGVQFRANYTWSHTLDEVSNGGVFAYDEINVSPLTQLNPTCLRCNNYGNADYDIRHNFSFDLVWETPSFKANRLLYDTIGGWTVTGDLFARSGLPYTILDENNMVADGGTIVSQPTNPSVATWGQTGSCSGNSLCYEPSAFVDPTADGFAGFTSYPTQRRNQYRGPGLFDANLSVMKNFKMTEKATFGVGANIYNVFNHPNFYLPNNYLSSADTTSGYIFQTVATPASPYGSFVGAAAAPRLVQLQAKISF